MFCSSEPVESEHVHRPTRTTSNVLTNSRFLDVAVELAEHPAHGRGGQNTNKTRDDERVVDHEAADVGRAGAVKLKSGQVGRIRRQNVVAVASGREGNHESRRRTDLQSNRNDRRNSSCLRVHELRHKEEYQCIRPRSSLHPFNQNYLQVSQVGHEHRIGHPSHAVHSNDCNATSMEHRGLTDERSADAAEHHHQGTSGQHAHLNKLRHAKGLLADNRTQARFRTKERNESNRGEEDPEGGPSRLREDLADQRRGFTVDVLLLFRIGDQLLEFRILVEILAAEGRIRAFSEQTDDKKDILKKVDHTLLGQTATWDDIRGILDDAMKYEAASACIPAAYVKQAAEYVAGKLPICTVIGFPNGYNTTAVKVFETKDAIANGASEIDMVINIGFLKDGRYEEVENEIRAIHEACDGRILKVIIETCLLTEEEKIKMCEIVTNAGAEFIKTSTGFSTAGATFADVELMKKYIGKNVKVKAAGGISSFDDAEKFISLGAERLGTSRLIKILKNTDTGAGY